MTVVCMLPTDNGVYFASDRGILDGTLLLKDDYPKWNQVDNGIWIGCAGARRATQTILNGAHPNLRDVLDDPVSIRQYFLSRIEAAGEKPNEEYNTYEFEALIIQPRAEGKSKCYRINNCLTVDRIEKGHFVAIGSGADVAYGAAFGASEHHGKSDVIVRTAVEAACEYERACRYPVDTWELDNNLQIRHDKQDG